MKKNFIIAVCLLAEAAGSAIAADRQKPVEQVEHKASRVREKCVYESRLRVYFSAHRAISEELEGI